MTTETLIRIINARNEQIKRYSVPNSLDHKCEDGRVIDMENVRKNNLKREVEYLHNLIQNYLTTNIA